MNLNEEFFKQSGIDPKLRGDISFKLYDSRSNTMLLDYIKNDLVKNRRHKSVGSIQSVLDMHVLMSKSLSIVSPNLVFSPDYPDYIIHSDDPEYMKSIPSVLLDDYKMMPHFREDLFERNFTPYEGVDRVPSPHITWSVVRSEPGTVGGNGQPFQGTQEVKGRQRELVLVFDESYSNVLSSCSDNNFISRDGLLYKFIKVKAQVFDNLVQYNAFTRSTWEAEELIEWFHKEYMLRYTGMFKEAGINEMIFNKRVRDDILLWLKLRYHCRSMLYYIRTELISNETIMPIRKVDVDMDVVTSFNAINKLNVNTDFFNKWHLKE